MLYSQHYIKHLCKDLVEKERRKRISKKPIEHFWRQKVKKKKRIVRKTRTTVKNELAFLFPHKINENTLLYHTTSPEHLQSGRTCKNVTCGGGKNGFHIYAPEGENIFEQNPRIGYSSSKIQGESIEQTNHRLGEIPSESPIDGWEEHHDSVDMRKLRETVRQGRLACCSLWGCKAVATW